jgi:hypothetical protein
MTVALYPYLYRKYLDCNCISLVLSLPYGTKTSPRFNLQKLNGAQTHKR